MAEGLSEEKIILLSERWLSDVKNVEGFGPRDSAIIERVMRVGRAASMFATKQIARERRLASDGQDIIDDQLRVIREVFGR